MTATFVYAGGFKTYAAAFAALEDMYAMGDVVECEVAGIVKRGKRWVVLLKA